MPSTPVPGISVSAVDNEVMWGTVAQPLPWLAYQDCPVTELEEQAWELKSESWAYKGGNVMVEDPTLSFSLSYSSPFSFDNFITYAFPDNAMDSDALV